MVWAPGQITAPPVADRIASSAQWLSQRLLDRDLLIVGYWTDWDYLNQVLGSVLDQVHPSKVIVVDPVDSASFQSKAPDLYALSDAVQNGLLHVKIGRAHVCTPVHNAHLVCSLLLEKHTTPQPYKMQHT